jgi:pilus assembly protein CpaB
VKHRVLIVALALLLAVLGTAGVLAYVRQADARAVAGIKAVSTLVAQSQIPSGTSASAAISAGLLRTQTLPASSVPPSAVRSLTPGLGGLVMSADVQPGQLLLRPMLVTAAQATGGVALPAGMIAVTINLCLPEAVAGAIRAGSEVEVFDTAATASGTSGGAGNTLTAGPNCTGPHQQQANGAAKTRVVLPRVQVISVGSAANGQGTSTSTTTASTSATANGSAQGNVLVTLAVSQRDAKKVIQITETGLPYLALLQPQT